MPFSLSFVLKFFTIFIMLLVSSSVLQDAFQGELGERNFFLDHGVFFLFFISLFPRLTLLFSSVSSGGFIWWLGFFICPRLLVASLATVAYLQTNPILVGISWVVAIAGEFLEKSGLGKKRSRLMFRSFRFSTPRGSSYERDFHQTPRDASSLNEGGVVEAEFTKKI